MAITVPSFSTTTWSSGSSVTGNKPSGLAVGDLMISHIVLERDDTNITAAPSGWTLIRSDLNNAPAGAGGMLSALYYKYATSGDVAASNFTWTSDGSASRAIAILRIVGITEIGAITANAGDISINNTSAPSFSITVTPNVEGNSLLLFFASAYQNSGNLSGYAIATSNPSWTELYDITGGSIGPASYSCAYAIRSQTTATGNASLTGGDATADWVGQMISIMPVHSFSASDVVASNDGINNGVSITVNELVTIIDSATTEKSTLWNYTPKNNDPWNYTNKL